MSSWVNPKIEVRDAGRKGRGLFAKELISKDELITINGGQIIQNKYLDTAPYKDFNMICFQVEKGLSICPMELDMNKLDGTFLANHFCDPNCGQRGHIGLVAMRNIQPGEKITYDYVMTDADYEGMDCKPQRPMKCFCDSPNCRKIITGSDWRRKDLQAKYQGYFSPYFQEMIDELNKK